jgi:DNA-directed RNA polymerase subunit L
MFSGAAADHEEPHGCVSEESMNVILWASAGDVSGGRSTFAPATLKKRSQVAGPPGPPMEIRIVEKEHDLLRVEFPKGEETLLIPLVEALQKEEKVVEARYYLGHPYLDRPTLYLKTKGEKPQQVLKRVLKDLTDLYGDLLADFEKKADKVKT